MKDRQLPVVVLTILAAGLGGVMVVAGLALLKVAPLAFLVNEPGSTVFAGIVGVAQLVVGVASLVLAFGFWLQRSWSWGLGISIFGLSAVLSLAGLVSGVSTLGSAIFLLAVSLLMLWYLYQPKTRTVLGR